MSGLPAPAAEVFHRQAEACRDLDSPFMARLLDLIAGRLAPDCAIGARIAGWPGDIGPSGASVPLRLAGALHALVLSGDFRLRALYPPREASDDALWSAVSATLTTRENDILRWLDSAPQTNEVRRSAALISAAAWLRARCDLPLRLSELGASAGLNLMFDRFAMDIGGQRFGAPDPALILDPKWSGPLPPACAIEVAERRGVDLNPVDPHTPDGRLRLLAYLWADQPERIARTEAAIAAAAATVDRADAVDWLETRLVTAPGQLHLVYHTIAWQYFPAERQARGKTLLAEAGRRATPEAPLARLAMEGDGGNPGAGMRLTHWPGGETLNMGRIDYHGRWVDWRAPSPR